MAGHDCVMAHCLSVAFGQARQALIVCGVLAQGGQPLRETDERPQRIALCPKTPERRRGGPPVRSERGIVELFEQVVEHRDIDRSRGAGPASGGRGCGLAAGFGGMRLRLLPPYVVRT